MNNKNLIYNTDNRPVNFIPSRAEAVTPSDSTVLEPGSLYVGTGGDVVLLLVDDSSTVTFSNVQDGTFLPLLVKQVYDTNTTASNIVILR